MRIHPYGLRSQAHTCITHFSSPPLSPSFVSLWFTSFFAFHELVLMAVASTPPEVDWRIDFFVGVPHGPWGGCEGWKPLMQPYKGYSIP